MALAHHSALWCSHESGVLFYLLRDRHAEHAFRDAIGRVEGTWLGKENVSLPEFLRYAGLGLNALYTSRSGGKRWIDQTPINTTIAHTLSGVFPGARFLHILRDSRRVVHSMVHFKDTLPPVMVDSFEASSQLPEWAVDFRSACRTWCAYVDSATQFTSTHSARCFTIVNEELSADPHEGFGRIFRFLNVGDEDRPSNFFRSSRLNSSLVPSVWGSAEPGGGAESSRPPAGAAEPWKEWAADDKDIFREEVLPTVRKYKLHSDEQLASFLD